MSRVGNKQITLPTGVTVTVNKDIVQVKGPKGELSFVYPAEYVDLIIEGSVLTVGQKEVTKSAQYQGLARAMINNMVVGVSEGYSKKLEIHGVGYKAQLKGKDIHFNLGFSHPVVVKAVDGITFEVEPKDNTITVSGIDLQLVGEVSAKIRALRKPEPYKGKGIRYAGEKIIRKAGKSAA